MRRVWVVGNSGSGKSTLSRELAGRLGTSWVELDSIYHGPGWTQLDVTPFRARVASLVAADCWVVDGNYSAVADLVRARADTVVWLDLPRRDVMRQIVPRTLGRMATRQELWNGNRERWSSLFRMDPERSIIRWAWTQHGRYIQRYETMADHAGEGVTFVRLRSRAEVRSFLDDAARPTPDDAGAG